MISLDSFNKDQILQSTSEFSKADPSIVELVIYAFYLVEQLSLNGLNFVFKGGTSLLLFFNPPFRFSTDVDIVTQEKRAKIENILDEICKAKVFSRWSLDERRSYKEGIPKAHYKFSFYSQLEDKEREILLDILFEENVYPAIVPMDVTLPYITTNGELVKINVPPPDALLGDKLTAFAPGTIGIQFNSNKGRDIIKQAFDIGCLFTELKDIKHVQIAFQNISLKEIEYRSLNIEFADIAKDVLSTSLLIARIFLNKKYEEDEKAVQEIKAALIRFRPFTTSKRPYTIDSLLLDASIASYLTAIIAKDNIGSFQKFDKKSMDLYEYTFSEPDIRYVNRLTRMPNGSLYYLWSAYKILYY